MKHALKSHVRVIRNGKTPPAVVVSSHLQIKGVGMVHVGPGSFYVRHITYGKAVKGICLDGSTWTAPWEAPRRLA